MASERTRFKASSKRNLCPVCEGNHKCSIGDDGLILCGRRQGQQPGFVHLGAAKGDPQYHQYRREGNPVLEARQAEYEAAHPHKTNGQARDWPRLTSEFEAALSPARRDELAADLGVPADVLSVLQVAFKEDEGCWTFPERDGTGKIVGINRRWKDGRKKAMAGGKRGLSIPPSGKERGGTVFCPEGASNTLALWAMGRSAIGRPNNTGGIVDLALQLFDVAPEREIVIVGDFDVKENGDFPGKDGAIKTASELSAKLNRTVKWCLPPDKEKDVRVWLYKRTFDRSIADAWHETGELLSEQLKGQGEGKHFPNGQADAYSTPKSETQKEPPVVETFAASDLMREEIPPPRWAVDGVLPEGLTILAGKPKLGKSWLALHLALAISSGGVALGRIPVECGDVLYLALEDTKRRLQSRIRKLLGPVDSPSSRLTLATAWPRMDKGGMDAIAAWIEQHPEARAVIIDTWARFKPRRPGKPDYDIDYDDGTCVKKVADEYGIPFDIITHCRKLGSEDPVEEVCGSVGLTGACDGVLVLRRERGQHDATLFVTGRDVDEAQLALTFAKEYCLWQLAGDAESYRISKERQRVIDLLTEAGRPLAPSEAAPLLGKKLDATKQLLWRMAQTGQIGTKDGRYFVLDKNESPRSPESPYSAGDSGHSPDSENSHRNESLKTPWG